jgi:predicted CoA-binding protein
MTPSSSAVSGDTAWRRHLIDDDAGIRALLQRTRRIAVLGIKTPESGQPAYYVAEYAKRAGYEIVRCRSTTRVTEILGETVYRTLAAVPGEIDMVDVFRRARDIDAHVDDILAKRPASVWFQLGIRNDAAGRALRARGDRRRAGPLSARGAGRDRALSHAARGALSARRAVRAAGRAATTAGSAPGALRRVAAPDPARAAPRTSRRVRSTDSGARRRAAATRIGVEPHV